MSSRTWPTPGGIPAQQYSIASEAAPGMVHPPRIIGNPGLRPL